MLELETAIKEIENTVGVLRRSSCERWVVKLEQLLADVRAGNDFCRKRALFQMGEFCNPKSLGDAWGTDMDFQTWSAQLGKLHDACARAFNFFDGPKV